MQKEFNKDCGVIKVSSMLFWFLLNQLISHLVDLFLPSLKKQRNGKIQWSKSYFIGQIKNYKQMIMAFTSHQMINIFLGHGQWVLKMIEVNKIMLILIILSLKRCAMVLITFKKEFNSLVPGHNITSKQKK